MRLSLSMLVLLAAALLPGCGSLHPREVVVALDDSLSRSASRPTIQVDLVGLNNSERKAWDEMPLSAYWLPESTIRAGVRDRAVRVRFSPERSQPFVISVDSDVWKTWQRAGATWLYVVANLPGGVEDKRGADDPRRLAISLSSKEWAPDAPLQIEIRRDAVVFLTPRTEPASARSN